MNSTERSAALSLAGIMCLRMLGLFMVLPLFSLYASQLQQATPFLIGLSMGIYGLTQALLQIPLGAWSDHIGRKKVITLGLGIFILGSLVCANSTTIWSMIAGRALQGAGAVGSTLIALLADLTRESERTKAMAIIGITIGLSFSLAMLLGPLFHLWLSVSGLFWLAAGLSFLGIILLYTSVPHPEKAPTKQTSGSSFLSLLKNSELFLLNLSIFLLHAIFMASFVVIPISLKTQLGFYANQQWMMYLPSLLLAFIGSIIVIIFTEKKRWVKYGFIGAIFSLGLAELLFWIFPHHLMIFAMSIFLFFTGFSILEAFLPSLISKTAPPERKGAALGIYSCCQFLGIFVGGTGGGWLLGLSSLTGVYLACTVLAFLWAILAFQLKNPQHSFH